MANEFINVSSSNIESVRYCAGPAMLWVRFLNGTTYCYHDVPLSAYKRFMEAPSKGTFLNAVIKPHYHFTKGF